MKKLYTLVLALGIAGMATAQKTSTILPLHSQLDTRSTSGERAPTDTLGINEFFGGGHTPTINGSVGGGFVVGNNAYGDKQKAQVYLLSGGTIVEEILFWFGAKVAGSGNANSKIVAKVYATDGTGRTTAGPNQQGAPNTVLSSVDILVSAIDTSGAFTVAALPAPRYVGGDFAVGFDVSGIAAGDSVGLVATNDGDGAQAELVWEQWSNNKWATLLTQADSGGWGLDVDIAAWPVVDNSSAGIESNSFLNGIKMSQNQPNPARFETAIQYEIENNAKVTFEMYDVAGKKVLSLNEGEQNKGKHTINITTEKLASGTYYYTLKANDNRLTKKLVITK